MFNLLKSEKVIIQQIHDDFDSAQDRLLCEARQIIQRSEPLLSKGERLHKAGFVSSEKAVEYIKNSALKVESLERANVIEYYKQTYPFNKFITENELERICRKYKLVFAPVERYKKDVPDKNLREIENTCLLKVDDYPKDKVWAEINYDGIINIGKTKAVSLGLPLIIHDKNFKNWQECDDYLRKLYPEQTIGIKYITEGAKNFNESRGGLFICAPKSHFDLKGLTKNRSGFMNLTMFEIKDPIVFRYVKGGVQIITKWGLEASDPIVVNEINN